MARLARAVAPGYPHHVTQRGNRRQKTFFCDQDYQEYIKLVVTWCAKYGVEIWAYCLMPNHVHLIATPNSADSLARAIGGAHRRYTRMVNFRQGWRGYLWQGRFASFPMDEEYLLMAAKYIELNPVRAGLCEKAEAYPWSSARAHLRGKDDSLVKVSPLLDIVGSWQKFLSESLDGNQIQGDLRGHERTGRPLGSQEFITKLENITGRILGRQKPGPKRDETKR